MEQTESFIPQTPYLSLNLPACAPQRCPAPAGPSFAMHRLPSWGWVERSNPYQICLYDGFQMQHYSLSPPTPDHT